MVNRGLLFVISGFSGTGKGTVIKRLISDNPEEYKLSISATTRAPREGETDGVEYFFKTVEEFEDMIACGDLIEYTKYVSNYYGTPKHYVQDMLDSGKNVILEIEIEGALNVKNIFPDAILIFLLPPSVKELENRLIGRATESADVIAERIKRAEEEIKVIEEYDYVVINDDLEECIDTIKHISDIEKLRTHRRANLITDIKKDLENF